MKFFRSFLFLTILLLIFNKGFSQSLDSLKINGSFQSKTVAQILNQWEADYPLQIFFPDDVLPESPISINFKETPLPVALNQLLEKTPLSFLLYRNYAVVIGAKRILGESYSSSYYETLEKIITPEVQTEEETEDVIIVGSQQALELNKEVTITGTLIDDLTKEPVIGATVIFPDLDLGSLTNVNGKFKLAVPSGRHKVLIQSVGYNPVNSTILAYSSGEVELQLPKNIINLDEVVVEADAADANVERVMIGVTKLDLKKLQRLPAFMGETDVVKALLLQPGVSQIGEGAAGINVRGGEIDQNLIMQNEGFIFNSSHALGFVSTFNPDLINQVELYKGNIPAQFGGRVASVLDVRLRNGSFQRLKLKGGVGPVTSRINLETPVIKDKSSLNIGLRSTYSDWLLGFAKNPEVKESSAFFYDANVHYAHRVNDKNTLGISFYATADEFRFANDFGFDYQTFMGQANYRSNITEKWFSNFTFTASSYQSTQFEFNLSNSSELDIEVNYLKLKEVLTYVPNENLKIDGGISSIYYSVKPGEVRPKGEFSVVAPVDLETEQALESSLFVQSEWSLSEVFSISAGIRGVLYQFLGPQSVLEYESTIPNLGGVTGQTDYGSGEVITTYSSLEPRFSLRYRLLSGTSIKMGYSRTAQFINQISNFTSPNPTNVWQLSTPQIEPVRSHNFSVGVFKNFRENQWETSAEVFYRDIDALFDFKDFALLNANPQIERELASGVGRAYGLELSIQKKFGLFEGWLSYTLSRTERQIEGVNNENWYPSNFDKPHDVSLVAVFKPNQRHNITFNFNYATGRPITTPVGNFQEDNGFLIPVYTDRNSVRIPDYHRLDVAYTVGQGYNKTKKFKTSWTFSVYNIYSRRNAYSVFFEQNGLSNPAANRLSILGSAFPSITFNFELL